MRKILAYAFVAFLASGVSSAFAQSSPPDPANGPDASPPGYTCTASGGVVTCVKNKSSSSQR